LYLLPSIYLLVSDGLNTDSVFILFFEWKGAPFDFFKIQDPVNYIAASESTGKGRGSESIWLFNIHDFK
jgi:hypothetical protein